MNGIKASGPKPIEATRMLIGEGIEEVLFFEGLLTNLGISGVQIESFNGKSSLGSYLKALKNRSGIARLEKLGIVRDADDDAAGAAASVESAIAQAAFSASLAVSKFIVPGGLQVGALETLCLRTVAGQPIETCIEDYLTCATRATSTAHTTTTNKAKARIHVWLAAQEEPDLRLGHAAKKGLVDWASPAFDELKAFVREMA